MANFNDKGVVSLSITSKLALPSYKNDIHGKCVKRIIFTAWIQCTCLACVVGVERSRGSGRRKKGTIREKGKGLLLPFPFRVFPHLPPLFAPDAQASTCQYH